ncbi:BtrH N-terminal domain-containing protein [Peribacillus alkalitolerans]|uniref:BtrH N-terminal domain-containing protein n=1 Tax=Peribacillus alkalitolerans TaxID=1550385 RepID=UPI0013D15494|nr:BtrH N-terminal domain-containing protein [Peribacillus alkalitolerans]
MNLKPGFHDETNALKNLIHFHTKPEISSLLSEEMILGIGGGIGYGYFTFYYEKEDFSSFFLGTRANWESHVDFVTDVLANLGVNVQSKQTKSKKLALDQLVEHIEKGNPPVIAIHTGVFEDHNIVQAGYPVYTIVNEIDKVKGTATVVHRFSEPVQVQLEDLIEGRYNLATSKLINQAVLIKEPAEFLAIDEERIILAAKKGIELTIKHANNPRMSNFGITALDKWIERLTMKGKQGWMKLFSKPHQFIDALYYSFKYIVFNTDGSAFRKAYSTFLKFVGEKLENHLLLEASDAFEESSILWGKLANASLPNEVEAFGNIKELFYDLNNKILVGETNHKSFITTLREIRENKREAATTFHWEDEMKMAHLSNMKEILTQIREKEAFALQKLEQAVQSESWERV